MKNPLHRSSKIAPSGMAALAVLAGFCPGIARAHVGHHDETSFAGALEHLVSSPAHVLAVLAAALVVIGIVATRPAAKRLMARRNRNP